MPNFTISKKNIYKLLSSSLLLFTVFTLVNCETENVKTDYSKPGLVIPKSNESIGNKPVDLGPVIDSIKLLDLKSIYFIPSNQPLGFPSIAVGDVVVNGNTRNKISLTNSGWTHPSVLYFETAWNGYHYWCAITPYPNSDPQYENPHIFCSNDGITWNEPINIVNPINYSPIGLAYSSDVNLMFNDGSLYCYWRDNGISINGLNSRALMVKKSSDGVNWTPKELVASWSSGIDVIAPSIVKNEKKYYCYGVCVSEALSGSYYTQYCIRRAVSENELGFTIDRNKGYDLINIEGRPWGIKQEPWHTDVQKIGNVWLMLVTTTDNGQYGANGALFMGYSLDGKNFSFNNKPICNSIGTYKSGFVPTYDRQNKRIKIQLWRAQVANNWQVFYDEFLINIS
ncbi:hypothetical protein QLS31_05270 [Flavobacterium sp. XS2P24]|uniref:hypothetical protein n=1 Tax=Flavobacterium sp. XS2P24 TaxID=3041249 RepID=UPI0024A90E83|nr:hypothetical protein [Flavobacterium sp. XS2P24]MDI6049231.1 hypothetical protein [Flavobacterium sp. XS2P24]